MEKKRYYAFNLTGTNRVIHFTHTHACSQKPHIEYWPVRATQPYEKERKKTHTHTHGHAYNYTVIHDMTHMRDRIAFVYWVSLLPHNEFTLRKIVRYITFFRLGEILGILISNGKIRILSRFPLNYVILLLVNSQKIDIFYIRWMTPTIRIGPA